MRFITLSLFATLLSAPAFAAELGTYRPGTPYNTMVAGGADICDSQCSGDAQCRGWNYVKPNQKAAGICEFLSSVSAPISSQVSISGESVSVRPFSSRLTAGGTNTVRVGTQVSENTVTVGQSESGRNIVRHAPTQRIVTQQASTRPVENMSLTAQQNRYRKAQTATAYQGGQLPQANPYQYPQQQIPQQQAYAAPQQKMFYPMLDGAAQVQPQRQPQIQPTQLQASRRVTGPRNYQNPAQGQVQGTLQGQGYVVPQFQNPRMQAPQYQDQNPNYQGQPFQRQAIQAPQVQQNIAQQQGSSRPPIGQAIQAPEPAAYPQPSTPSQRLAQMTAETRSDASAVLSEGPVALNPEQARRSLFGQLNDDLKSFDLPTASAVPTQAVSEQPIGAILAGGI